LKAWCPAGRCDLFIDDMLMYDLMAKWYIDASLISASLLQHLGGVLYQFFLSVQ
jgi:hypothetical protein